MKKDITVPRTPESAYNPDRPVNVLVQAQIRGLQQVVYEDIKTERQAVEYLRDLTARVQAMHPHIKPRGYRGTRKKRR